MVMAVDELLPFPTEVGLAVVNQGFCQGTLPAR